MVGIYAEKTLEGNFAEIESKELKQEMKDIFNLMNELNSSVQINSKHNEQEIQNMVSEMEKIKTKLMNDLNENYDRKLQKVLENIKKENQEMWDKNV